MVDEKDLIARAAANDTAAFEALVRTYEQRVYNLALRFTGSRDDAFDLSQEVFLRVYNSLPHFRGDAKLSTWIYRLTSNVCIDFDRARKRRSETPLILTSDEGGEETLEVPDLRYSPESTLEQTELRDAVNAAVLRLSADHREIFLMREVGGLSYAEIAEALELDIGTVKSRLARCREQLRRMLTASGNFRSG